MNTTRSTPRHWRVAPFAAALALACLAPWSGARATVQEGGQGLPPELDRILGGGEAESLEQQMRALFAKVERALRSIDDMLFEAGAGDPLDDDIDSGLGELLDSALAQSRGTVDDIDRILDIAQELSDQQQQQGGGGSSSGQQQQGESPLDGRTPPRQGQEQTPERPDSGLDPSNREQDGEEPGSEPQTPEGQEPEGGRDGGSREQTPGAAPDDPRGDPASPASGGDPWGDLPPRVQQIFRTQGGADMPPAYRGWIDAYHRRLGRSR